MHSRLCYPPLAAPRSREEGARTWEQPCGICSVLLQWSYSPSAFAVPSDPRVPCLFPANFSRPRNILSLIAIVPSKPSLPNPAGLGFAFVRCMYTASWHLMRTLVFFDVCELSATYLATSGAARVDKICILYPSAKLFRCVACSNMKTGCKFPRPSQVSAWPWRASLQNYSYVVPIPAIFCKEQATWRPCLWCRGSISAIAISPQQRVVLRRSCPSFSPPVLANLQPLLQLVVKTCQSTFMRCQDCSNLAVVLFITSCHMVRSGTYCG